MTLPLLMRALKARIEQIVYDRVDGTPAVHLGFLPQRNKSNAHLSEFPFIIIRPVDGGDEADGGQAKIKLLFGTKSEDDDGFLDVLNLMESVRVALLRHRVLDQRYRLEIPYKWKFFDEQPEPEWIGEAVTIWTLPTVEEEVEGL